MIMLRKLRFHFKMHLVHIVDGRRRFLLYATCFLLLVLTVHLNIHKRPVRLPGYKTILDSDSTNKHRVKNTIKILIWTTVFGGTSWYDESIHWAKVKTECPNNCILTKDKSEIKSADAVVFHLNDITLAGNIIARFSNAFPAYRHPDQVWILYNNEPITRIFGDLGAWQGVFNWTWTFKRSSEVFEPHGRAISLNNAEMDKVERRNYYHGKSKPGAIAMISDCTDEARRYRIVGKLGDYIDVKVVGDCGEKCPTDVLSCETLLPDYRFYLALENSDCADYVTEKYWRSLDKNMIPIVAWKTSMEGLVLPGSYINVFDFPDLDAAGRYIQKVDHNESLYNSYFRWKLTHKIVYRNYFGTSHWCNICKMIQNNSVPRMVYHDMRGWFSENETEDCQPVTITSFLRRALDRFFYDFRFSLG